jgi:hypothetical protein
MLPYIYRGHGQAGFFAHGCGLGGTSAGRLEPARGNAPPPEQPYLCIVPLRDAWRAIPSLAGREGGTYFADALEPAVLDDLRRGRSLLLLDMSNEGPEFIREIFASLHQFAIAANLPPSRLVWLDQNRATPGTYADITGMPRAEGIQFEHYDFFLKVTAWMFSPKAGRPVLAGIEDSHAARMFDSAAKERLLLCLNATPRLHRVVTLGGLIQAGLFDEALVSFPGLDMAKDGDVGSAERVCAYLADNPGLAHLAEGCERAIGLRGLKVDDFAETGNALFDRIDPRPYQRTFFSLVTETEFTTGTVDRVTEKIAKAFCLGHPTMVVGNPRALRFMTELGFHDFAPLIDPAYDQDPSPARRLTRILAQAQALSATIRADPAEWLARAREAGEANVRLATSGRMMDAYVALHEHPVLERLERRLAAAAG